MCTFWKLSLARSLDRSFTLWKTTSNGRGKAGPNAMLIRLEYAPERARVSPGLMPFKSGGEGVVVGQEYVAINLCETALGNVRI